MHVEFHVKLFNVQICDDISVCDYMLFVVVCSTNVMFYICMYVVVKYTSIFTQTLTPSAVSNICAMRADWSATRRTPPSLGSTQRWTSLSLSASRASITTTYYIIRIIYFSTYTVVHDDDSLKLKSLFSIVINKTSILRTFWDQEITRYCDHLIVLFLSMSSRRQ